jgi:hypothetical protein
MAYAVEALALVHDPSFPSEGLSLTNTFGRLGVKTHLLTLLITGKI